MEKGRKPKVSFPFFEIGKGQFYYNTVIVIHTKQKISFFTAEKFTNLAEKFLHYSNLVSLSNL
jgi:hypothetical protein